MRLDPVELDLGHVMGAGHFVGHFGHLCLEAIAIPLRPQFQQPLFEKLDVLAGNLRMWRSSWRFMSADKASQIMAISGLARLRFFQRGRMIFVSSVTVASSTGQRVPRWLESVAPKRIWVARGGDCGCFRKRAFARQFIIEIGRRPAADLEIAD